MNESDQRRALAAADKLRQLKDEIAQTAREEFYALHPEWLELYGEQGWSRSLEDGAYHIEFLASSIEIGSIAAFQNYVAWTMNILRSRCILPESVADHLRLIGRQLKARLRPSESERVLPFLEAGKGECREIEAHPKGNLHGSLSRMQSVFLQSLVTGQRKAALAVALEALKNGYPPQEIYSGLFQRSLYEVGKLWETNQITIADEHMATAIAQFVIAQVYSKIPPSEVCYGNVVMTGVEGELHQIGANIVADMLDLEGFDVRFLGTNMPDEGIVQAVHEHRAETLGISATMLFSIPKVRRIVSKVQKAFGDKAPQILLGGSAFRFAPDLLRRQGVPRAVFDVASAVELMKRGRSANAARHAA